MNPNTPSLAIVVASCDKYSDLWKPLFGQFFKHWPDCPYPIYLVANHKRVDDSRVTTLLAGEDQDWSTTIAKAIEQLPHSHLLFWIDDAFLIGRVSNQKLESLFNFVTQNKVEFLRMRPDPKPSLWLNNDIGILNKQAAYRVNLFATIWNIEMLKKILRPGESAWQFEMEGTERSRKYDGFYCTKKHVFRFLHGVERGVWILPTAKKLQALGYVIDGVTRAIMNKKETLGLQYRLFKSWVLHRFSEKRRAYVLRFVRNLYNIVGLR